MQLRLQRHNTKQTRGRCGRSVPVCGGRARALGLIAAVAGGVIGCGGGDDSSDGSAADAGPISCEERRIEPLPTSTFSIEPIRVEVGGISRAVALGAPRSTLLPPSIARPRHPVALASSARATGMRILLIAPTEERPSYQAAAAALQRIGVPHDVLLSAGDALERDLLWDENDACRYSGVILSHTDVAYDDGSGWQSTLSDREWDLLAEYEQTCGAREVIWYAEPSADLGLAQESSFDDTMTETATLTDAGAERFPYVVRTAAIPIEEVFGFRATVSDPATTTPLLQTSTGEVLAAVHTRADQTEVLAVTVDSGLESVHSQLIEFGVIEWLTRGLFIGKRRVYLSPQIDDVFLKSALWSDGGGEATYRMTADDVGHLRDWSSGLSSRLPHGSSVHIQLAFNGAGAQPGYDSDQSVVDALLGAQGDFFWINHTWDHANLDAAEQDTVEEEIGRNCQQAADWGLTHFSCTEAVTPELTGLNNPDAVAGLLAAGVRHVVSDASKNAADYPDNPGSNPAPNMGRQNPIDPALLQVPRHPTSIFFDVSTVAEETGLYNDLYRDFWGRDLSYQEIIEVDTELGLAYLLAYDVDPLMFHQANLRFWSDGTWHSLYTDWLDRLLERFTALVDLPIIGLEMNDIAAVMKDRDALERCGLTATLSADRTSIHLESVGACVVPITGLDAPDAGRVEHYAGVPTTHVELAACDERDIAVP
jgi:hypothetical protein